MDAARENLNAFGCAGKIACATWGTRVSLGKAGVFAGARDLPSMLKILKDFQCVAGRDLGGWQGSPRNRVKIRRPNGRP
jgi:hypothetical protein